MTQTTARPVRWAILGTGPVARKFVLDLRCLGGAAVAQAVASRDPANARRFAADLGVAEAVPDYATAVAGADAVYIATPPAQHEAHALLAIRAGKAVLVEKPFATDAAAARRIAAAATDAGVFCMEAMWTRFQPLLAEVRRRISAGDLGEVRGFEARFMAANRVDPGSSLFDPDRGGGALLHRGVYPLSLARDLLGPVTNVQSLARVSTSGVDEDTLLTLRHASGALTSLRASLRAHGPDGAAIYGTKGTLYLEGPIWRPTGARLHRTVPQGAPGGPRRFEAFRESGEGLRLSAALGRMRRTLGQGSAGIHAPFAGNGYHHQAQAVMDAVAAGRTEDPRMPLAQSIEVMEIIDRAKDGWSGAGWSDTGRAVTDTDKGTAQ